MKNLIILHIKKLTLVTLMLLSLTSVFSQVQQQFTPRFNQAVKGDFGMVANNMLSRTATGDYVGEAGNHDFTDNVYVDIDSDATTFNSSSANFKNPAPNAKCLSIIRAYLYWAAADKELSNGGDNQPSWNFDDVKLMLPGQTTYTTLTADQVLFRGRTTHFINDPYVCVKDISSLVSNLANPFGKYQVANVEAKTGSVSSHDGNNTGTSAGWQVVFVYESPDLKQKNITLFDGYAHVTSSTNNFDIDFNGFVTVPNGAVKSNALIGALEGDRDLSGDRLQIRNTANTFVDIDSPLRDASNFFNSRITIGNSNGSNNFTDRNPASTNTLGFDAGLFPLKNDGNKLIDNNQTSATFRLTSNQETYGLYLMGLAIEVYKPDISPVVLNLASGNATLDPGSTINFDFNIINSGNDDVKDLVISTTVPSQVANVIVNNLPTGVSYTLVSNVLTFTVDNGLVYQGSPELFIEFEFIIQDECYFLEDSCDLEFGTQFSANYVGEINPDPQTTVSSSGVDGCNLGNMLPYTINVNQPIATWDTAAGNLDRTVECNNSLKLQQAQALVPVASCVGLTAVKNAGGFVADQSCANNGTYTNTFNFIDVCGVTISNYTQVITVLDTTNPEFSTSLPTDITVDCNNIPDPTEIQATDNCGVAVVTFDETRVNGSCPGNYTLTRIWTATDQCNLTVTHTQTISVEDNTPPVFIESLPPNQTVNFNSIPNAPTLTANDNCGDVDVIFTEEQLGDICNGSYTLTRTWTAKDECDLTTEHIQILTVTQPVLDATITAQTNVLCFGLATGSATAAGVDGTGGYTYSWNTSPVQTGTTASNLTDGTYTVTVTDTNGCTDTVNVTITEPTAALQTGASSTDETCNNCDDGTLSSTPTGGSLTYVTYVWDLLSLETDGSSQTGIYNIQNVSNVPPGTYQVTVTDSNGCSATDSVVIDPFNCNTAVVIDSIIPTDVDCKGNATGSAMANVTANFLPLTYQWTNSSNTIVGGNSSTLSNIITGVYTVLVIDNKGCFSEASVTIGEPVDVLVANASTNVNQQTLNGTEGEVTANPTGGTVVYTYSWANANSPLVEIGITQTLGSLLPGDYIVTVTDSKGCIATSTTTINAINCNISLNGSFTEILCNGNTSTATATITGGTAPFTYTWTDATNTVIQTTNTTNLTDSATGLQAGEYTVSVLDFQACPTTTTITIIQPAILSLGIAINPVACKGDATGSIDLTVSGGSPGYTYSWIKDGVAITNTTQDLNNLLIGLYEVTVTDIKGCTAVISREITEPSEIVGVTIAGNITNIVCFGDTTGELTANSTGGTVGSVSDYSYSWDTNPIQTTQTISNLGVGSYTVTTTDLNGCEASETYTITGPLTALTASITSQTNVVCGASNGLATITPTGGMEPYTYAWDDTSNQNTATATNLASNTYNVIVTDLYGCTVALPVTISDSCIALVKTAIFNDENQDNCANVDETISYTFTLTNTGNANVNNIALTDPLLQMPNPVVPIVLVSGDTNNDNELDPTETWIYTAEYAVTQTNIDSGQVTNQATVTVSTLDNVTISDISGITTTTDDATVITLCTEEGIALVKAAVFNDEDQDNCTDVGETISYTFTLTNTGNVSIDTIVLTDPLLEAPNPVVAIVLVSGDTDNDNELDPTETWTYTADYTVTQADIDAAQVTNQATVNGQNVLTDAPVSDISGTTATTDDATVITLCQGDTTIALVKAAVFNDEDQDNCTDVGETVSYTFTLTNTGNVSIDTIVLTDPLLEAPNPVVAIVLVSGDTDNDNELDPTETWTYTADYTVTQADIDAAQVTNQATVNGQNVLTDAPVSDISGTTATTDDATVITLCQGDTTIALVKAAVFNDEDQDNCTDVGETVSYTFTLTNTGNVSIDTIVLTDPLLEAPNPVVAIVLVSGDTDNDNELDPTETWTYTADYTVTQADIDAAQVTNQATVNGQNVLTDAPVSDISGTTATTDDATVITLCQGDTTIALVKAAVFNDEDQDNCTDVGETVSYTFTLTNTGNVSIDTIVLTDPLLEAPNPVVAIVLVSGDTDNDNELDPTETWTYTADYTVTQADIDAAQVTNQATVNGQNVLTDAPVSDISGTTATTDDATVITLCQGDTTIALVKAAVFNDEDQDNCTDVGETVSYTFTLTNTGNVSIDTIVLTDPLLEAPNPVVAIVLVSGDTDNDNELDPTETWTYTADYTVTQADIDAAQVTNQATVNGQNVLTDAPVSDISGTTATTDDATVITLCQGDTTIALVKAAVFNDEDQDNCTDVGETISYTFTLTNTGNVSIDTIVLTDPLLEAPNPVVAIVLVSGDTDNDNELDPTETWTYTADYTVTQADIDAAQVTNQATVNGQNVLTDAPVSDISGTTATTDDATVITLCQGDTTIALVKAAVFNDEDQDNCTDVGETVSYTFTLTNTGNVSIDTIVLTDPLLEAPNPVVAIVLVSGDTDNDNELDPTETWTYTADYTVTQADIDAAQVTNQATVNGQNVLTDAPVSDISGTTATTDDATVITLCQGDTTIALVKAAVFNDEDQDNCTDVGETVSYTFTLTNTGNVSIDTIVLTDPLLEAPNPVVAIVLVSGDTDNDNELDPTETWTYTADYTVTQADIDAAQVTNQATVNGQNVLTDAPVNDISGTTATTDDATVITLCQGDTTIALVKAAVFNDEDQDNCTDVGETISYTFTLTNTGNVSIDTIVLTDPLLEAPNPVVAIVLVSGDTDNDNELDPTETWTYTADYTVTQADIDAAQVTNQATVNGQNVLTDAPVSDISGTTATTDDATVITLCQGDTTIALVKAAVFNDEDQDNCTDVGETVSYTFTLTNTGNVSIDTIVLTDPLLEAPNPVVAIVLVSGDTDNDNELDPTETWTYTADYTVTQADIDAAQVTNQATVNGQNVLTDAPVSDISGTTATTDDATVITLCQGDTTIALVKAAVFNDEDQDNCTDVGETVSYTFTLTNTGNVSIDTIVLTDPLLEAPNPVVAIVLVSGDTDNDNELDPTETWTYTADYTVTQADIDAAQVTNQATVNGQNVLTDAPVSDISGTTATTDDATVITLCQGDTTIALVKAAVFNDEDQDNCTDVGETVSYTFTLTNTGNVSIDTIVLTDPLLEAPNPVVAIVLVSGDTDNDNELDPTETWTYTADYTVTQADIDAAQVTNQATVNGQNVLTDAPVSDISGTTATTDDATVITLCQGDTTIALVKAAVFNDEDQDNCTDVGETVSYTFTLTNTGNVSIDTIVLTDPLLEAPNPVVAIVLVSGDTDNDNELDPTETWTYTADYTVTQADIDAAQVTNQATVNGQNVLTDAPVSDISGTTATTDDATVITLCQGDTTIALVKAAVFNDEDQDNCTDVGETVSYTFTLTNTGNVSIDTIVLTDPLLEAPNPVVAIVLVSGDTDNDNELDPTETWTYTADYTVTQADIDAAQVTNQATVNGQNVLTDAPVSDISGTTATTDDATVITLCQGDTTIALVKAAVFNDEDQDNCTDVGETVSYTFTLTNTGNVSIDTIVLTDPLLEAPNPVVAIVLVSGDTDNDNELDPTETWTYTADYTVTQADIDAAQVTNQATVNGQNVLTDAPVSDISGTTATTDDATVITLCQGDTTIALVKAAVFNDEDQDNCTDVGETVSYTFTLTNTGNVSIDTIVLTDPLLEAPNPVVAIVLVSGDTDNDNELDPTETWTYTADYTVTQADIDAAQVTNQATVNGQNVLTDAPVSDISGTTATTDDATVITLCQGDTTIALVKAAVFNDEDQDNCTDVGETVSYTFTLTNTGNVSIDTIVLTDPLLEAPNPVVAIVLVSGDTDNDNELDPTETWTYTADYTVTQADIDAAQVTNQATVNGQNVLTDAPVNDISGTTATTDDATVITLCQGDTTIALVKAAVFNDEDQDNCTDVGETVSYTFTLTNTGNVSIDTIVLTDPLLEAPNPVVAIVLVSGDTDNDNELDPTETWTYTADYTVTQADIDAAQVTNQATVNGQNVLTDAPVNDISGTTATTDDATVITLCQGDGTITIVKSATIANGEPCLNVGSEIIYTFTVINTSTVSINTVTINDTLLGGDITATLTLAGDDGDNILQPIETWIYTALNYTVTQADVDAGIITNTVTADGFEPNATPVVQATDTYIIDENNTDITLCPPTSGINIVKTAVITNGDPCLTVNSEMTYTFTLTNTGTVSVNNILITDVLLNIDNTNNNLLTLVGDTNNDGVLEPTETWIYTAPNYTVTQADVDAGIITNTVIANGVEVLNDTDVTATSTHTTGSDITFCPPTFGINIVKTGIFNNENGNDCTEIDETITYTFTVTNTGSISLENVIISDPLLANATPPVLIEFVSGDIDGDTQLDVTEIWEYTATYLVTQIDIDATEVNNTATATAQEVLTGTTQTSTSQIITELIEDVLPPDISNCDVLDETVECNGTENENIAINWDTANILALQNCATDACDNNFTVTSDYDFGNLVSTCGLGGTIFVTYTLTDATGNSSAFTATLTIEDTTAPDLTLCTDVADTTLECSGTNNDTLATEWDAANILALTTCPTDDCDADAVYTVTSDFDFANLVSTCGLGGTVLVTYTIADDCGNSINTSANLTIEDTTAPDLTLCTDVADTTLECSGTNNDTLATEWDAANILALTTCPTDDCDADAVYTVTSDFDFANLVSTCGLGGTVLVTYTIADDCGNSINTSATLTIEDTTGPDLTLCTDVADTTLECSGTNNDTLATEWDAANILALTTCPTDDCDADAVYTVTSDFDFANLVSTCGLGGTVLVTYTIADDCGNSINTSANLTIEDTTGPDLTLCTDVADTTLECSGTNNDTLATEWDAANILALTTCPTDDCDADATYTVTSDFDFANLVSTCGLGGTVLVTYTIADDCGNSINTSATLTIEDTTAPDLTLCTNVADTTLECNGTNNDTLATEWDAANILALTTCPTDDCDADATYTVTSDFDFANLVSTCGLGGTVLVTYTIADDCGNSINTSATLTIEDTTAPDLTLCTNVADTTLECNGTNNDTLATEWDAANILALTTCPTDDCDADATYTVTSDFDFANLVSTCGLGGTVLVTYTIADDCGNSINTSATLTIEDTTAPDLTLCTNVADTTLECNGTNNDTLATEWDAANILALTTCPTDDCDADATYTVTSDFDFANLVSTCGLGGTVLVTYTIADDCGNSINTSATLTIEDTTAPDLTLCTNVADTTLECNGTNNDTLATEWDAANILALTTCPTDDCDADATYTVTSDFDFANLVSTCGLGGTVLVTYTIADDCGNSINTSANLTIEDTTAPDLTLCTDVADTTLECSGTNNDTLATEWDAANILALTTCPTDDCDADAVYTVTSDFDFANLVSTCGLGGTVLVTYTIADDCGNSINTSANLTIEDTTGPDLTLCTDVADTTLECSGTNNDTLATEWDAANILALTTCPTDDCDADAVYTVTSDFDFANLVSTCGLGGTVLVTYTIADDCGNSINTSATLTIEDTTAPDLTLCTDVADTTLECNGSENETMANDWNATNLATLLSCGVDACDAEATNTVTSNYAFVNLNSDCGAGGTIEVTYTVADDCGNESILIATLTIEDTVAPTLLTSIEPESYVICSQIPVPPTLEFSDECSNVDVTIDFNETNNNLGDGEDYQIIWEWTVSDSCDNSNVYTHIVNVVSEDFVIDHNDDHCTIDGEVDLFDYLYLVDDIDDSGTWIVEQGDVILNNDGTFDPIDLELGDYIFNYSVTNGDCRATIRVTIQITDECVVKPCGVEGFIISKAVTPNGDGHNDFFTIQGDLKCGFIIDLQIFNRYGGIIYDAKDYKNDWSGQAIKQSLGKADKLPNGTYYYVIILRESGLDPITGPLYLGTK
ncbi:gliding motility-associated C-terminal domain-containing protein [Lacinutrix sp. Bg11-31]|uniref:DUF7507 domain-containing protein n=1 Tax=Lacinutrix sp. Bg11-31 TaxID=2057808 RepID=UPI0018E1E9F8|nr:gliding motility-associated C-terminal domain-containing protein [Lacinutrix sp. Bg11-31]